MKSQAEWIGVIARSFKDRVTGPGPFSPRVPDVGSSSPGLRSRASLPLGGLNMPLLDK